MDSSTSTASSGSGSRRLAVAVRESRKSRPIAATKAGARSEAIEEPGVGAAAGFPECHVTAVGRGDGPAQVFFGFLEGRLGCAAQVHMQERLNAGWRRGGNPDTAAIGGPIETGDSSPIFQRENTLFAAGDVEKPDVRRPWKPLVLGQGKRRAIGRERPVVQVPIRAFEPREKVPFPGCRIKDRKIEVIGREFADDAYLGRRPGALKIIDAGFREY